MEDQREQDKDQNDHNTFEQIPRSRIFDQSKM